MLVFSVGNAVSAMRFRYLLTVYAGQRETNPSTRP